MFSLVQTLPLPSLRQCEKRVNEILQYGSYRTVTTFYMSVWIYWYYLEVLITITPSYLLQDHMLSYITNQEEEEKKPTKGSDFQNQLSNIIGEITITNIKPIILS